MSSGKIFLLRHEERGNDVSFSASLTHKGLNNAKEIIPIKLKNCNIQTIYCSPFIRTLQTIAPYCHQTNIKVNLEWGLVESLPKDPCIPYDLISIINTNYKSIIPYKKSNDTDIIDYDELKQRVRTFLSSIDRSQNILIVTHLPVINAILSCKYPNIDMYEHHNTGVLLRFV